MFFFLNLCKTTAGMVYRNTELALQWEETSRAAMTQENVDRNWFLKFKTREACDAAAPCGIAAFHPANDPTKPPVPCTATIGQFSWTVSHRFLSYAPPSRAPCDVPRLLHMRVGCWFAYNKFTIQYFVTNVAPFRQQDGAADGAKLRVLLQLYKGRHRGVQRAHWRPICQRHLEVR